MPIASQVSPRPPQVASPPAPPVKPTAPSEPPETGWDDAPTATALPDFDPMAATPQRVPPVVVREPPPESVTKPNSVPPARPASVPPPRMPSTPPPPVVVRAPSVPPAPITPVALPQGSRLRGEEPVGLSASMRDEVWAIVRAAVEEGMKPVLAKQKELEARLAAAEAAAKARPAPVAAAPAPAPAPRVQTASIPVTLNASLAPAASLPATPRLPAGSIPPQGYGVTVMRASKPDIDLEAIAKIPIEMEGAWDGGRRKRRLGKVLVVLLLVGVVAMIVATIMSHNGG